MSTPTVALERRVTRNRVAKLRCSNCGTRGDFPASFTQRDATHYCEVCGFHRNHKLFQDHDPRCPICVARWWLVRLRAARILLFRPALLRSEDL
jgi:hypothetical protein